MEQVILIIAGAYGTLAVLLGAFGAHGLKKVLDPDALQSFETGVRYLMYHAIVLLVLMHYFDLESAAQRASTLLIAIGTGLFSLSIFILIWAKHKGRSLKKFGLVTPLGGLMMLLGWSLVVYIFLVQ